MMQITTQTGFSTALTLAALVRWSARTAVSVALAALRALPAWAVSVV
jgi:hypothetical protein